ncbi:pantothenate synthetase [Acrasis kona]|uniref:Pantoate--beta-alanine ligase n=1 Tax=Acrasis kona TaxID=1008807 RepID=A0AAW2ZFX6_9EUKA
MRVCRSLAEFQILRKAIPPVKNVGLVPTMGALHRGHLSLMELAKSQCDIVISTIFVNPTQFGPNEDLSKYPRQEIEDIKKLEQSKHVDYLLLPTVEDVYPKGFSTFVNVEGIDEQKEAKSRPGHFRGVTTVVSKLFNMTQPQKAYFGAKDAMQCIVIKKMVRDLNIPIEIVIGQTLREPDGLAMSSRNVYLSEQDRKISTILYKSLSAAEQLWNLGKGSHCEVHTSASNLVQEILKVLSQEPSVLVDYISVGSRADGSELSIVDYHEGAIISLAVKLGTTRLIDNIELLPK